MDKFYMGASYYPEWWPEEQWEEDFRKMAGLGFNAVRMGEFAGAGTNRERANTILNP
jgi:beta-galactosidase